MRARRGPLASSYPAAVALVVSALVPFLAVTAAIEPLSKLIGHDLRLGKAALQLTTGMSDAGYAVGTVISRRSSPRGHRHASSSSERSCSRACAGA